MLESVKKDRNIGREKSLVWEALGGHKAGRCHGTQEWRLKLKVRNGY